MTIECESCGAEFTFTESVVCPACRGDHPKRIGKYAVTGFLAAGGLGKVYKAIDPDGQRTVAVKLLRPPEPDDREFLCRYAREARCTAALDHPGIVKVHDSGADGVRRFIVMEFIDGRAPEGPMEPARALRIVRDAALAIHHAHEAGIVHRDIKPGNILVDADDRPHLLDFGLARAASDPEITAIGQFLGTPEFMAPEQRKGLPGRSHRRVDVYALGATLYTLLTGRLPSSAPTGGRASIEAICRKAMAAAPEDRYPTALALAEAIECVLKPGLLPTIRRAAARLLG